MRHSSRWGAATRALLYGPQFWLIRISAFWELLFFTAGEASNTPGLESVDTRTSFKMRKNKCSPYLTPRTHSYLTWKPGSNAAHQLYYSWINWLYISTQKHDSYMNKTYITKKPHLTVQPILSTKGLSWYPATVRSEPQSWLASSQGHQQAAGTINSVATSPTSMRGSHSFRVGLI